MTPTQKITALRKELREAKKSWSWVENRNIDLLAKIERLRERLTEAGVNLARAENEVLLMRRDGWSKVVNRAGLPIPLPRRHFFPDGSFLLTDSYDPFGRLVYRQL